MPGEPDLLLVLARRALLDVLDAIASHREAVILVGAQAIYFHTGSAELAVAEFTTDADLAIDPSRLQPAPDLEDELAQAGFVREAQPGVWSTTYVMDGRPISVPIDLLVPESVGGGVPLTRGSPRSAAAI